MTKKGKGKQKKSDGKRIAFADHPGIGFILAFYFRQEILDALKPKGAKPSIPERKSVVLYFSDEEGEFLLEEKREILKRGSMKEEAKEIVEELTRGSNKKLIPTLPAHTKVLALD
jgi:hypothetical protein